MAKFTKVTREDLKSLFDQRKVNCKNMNYQECYDRIVHDYLHTDGSFQLPDSSDGDIMKIFLCEFLFGGSGG